MVKNDPSQFDARSRSATSGVARRGFASVDAATHVDRTQLVAERGRAGTFVLPCVMSRRSVAAVSGRGSAGRRESLVADHEPELLEAASASASAPRSMLSLARRSSGRPALLASSRPEIGAGKRDQKSQEGGKAGRKIEFSASRLPDFLLILRNFDFWTGTRLS